MKTIRGFLFTLFICITVCDGAAQKMDSVMIDRIMVKIDSLESKIEGIKTIIHNEVRKTRTEIRRKWIFLMTD